MKRAVSFLLAFVIISGILGPPIISHGLVSKDGFQIYGGAGKALLFAVLALALLVRRKGIITKLPTWRRLNLIWIGLSALCVAAGRISINHLIMHDSLGWAVLTHAFLLSSVIFALIGSLGPVLIVRIIKTYRQDLLLSAVLFAGFFIFLYGVYGLWQILAAAVLHSVRWLLAGVGLHSQLLPNRTLLLSKFGINISKYCSGIDSIALFTGLYCLVGVLDWPKFNHNKLVGIFIPALLILFGFNILRVAVLILGGYYINPQIAFSLFHTYAGMVFFIIYSAIFWGIAYKWMLSEDNK